MSDDDPKYSLQGGDDTVPSNSVEWNSAVKRFPGYRILKEISRGGQGVVYQAIQESTRRRVALKVLLQGPYASLDTKRRFEREIALVGSLRHANIVPMFDSGVADGRCYYAMEYIRGDALNEHVRRQNLETVQILELFNKLCGAIDFAHQKGVIHRDLKPSNVLVDDAGEPHVLDFGLAKIGGSDSGDESHLLSVTGQIIGSPAYMCPEQAAGRPDLVDMRSDVYALGVVLYELLTGTHPYDVTGQINDVLDNIANVEPTRPSTVSRQVDDELETILLKALSKDKVRRYDTAGAFRRDIERYLKGEPIEAKRNSSFYVLKKTLSRYKIPVSVAAAFVLLVTASAIVFYSLYVKAEKQARLAEVRKQELQRSNEDLLREREQSDASRRQMLRLLSETLVTTSVELLDVPAVEDLLDKLLSDTLSHYEHQLAEFGDDPFVRSEVANGFSELAFAMGSRFGTQPDKADRSDSLRRKAIEIMDDLLAEDKENLDYRITLAQLLSCEAAQISTGPEAGKRAVEVAQTIVRDDPTPLHQYRLGMAQAYLSEKLRKNEQLDEARRIIRQAIQTFDKLALNHPQEKKYRWRLGYSQSELGNVLRDLGKLKVAEAAYREAADSFRAIAPWANLRYLSIRSHNDLFLAKLLSRLGDSAESESILSSTIMQLEQTTRDYPNADWPAKLYGEAVSTLAEYHLSEGGMDEAVKLITKLPMDLYAFQRVHFAESLWRAGRQDIAREHFRGCSQVNDPSIRSYVFASCPDVLMRDPRLALDAAKESVERSSGSTSRRRIADRQHLGVASYRKGDWLATIDAITEARKLRGSFDGFDYFFLAMSYKRLGREQEAKDAYDSGLRSVAKVQAGTWPYPSHFHPSQILAVQREAQQVIDG